MLILRRLSTLIEEEGDMQYGGFNDVIVVGGGTSVWAGAIGFSARRR